MRFHFNICDTAGVIPDEEGGEFSSLEEARSEARASIRDMMANDLRGNRAVLERRIEITNEDGAVLDRVGMSMTAN